jgi:hypothetical protein
MVNPIVRIDKSKAVPVYYVRKIIDDTKIKSYEGRFLEESDFHVVLHSDADVYTEDGELLLRFRKDVLTQKHINDAYEAMKLFIRRISTDRGAASGSNKGLKTGQKKKVMSNIMGYFDKWSIAQKSQFKKSGVKKPGVCRITKFTASEPEKWNRIVPLIQDIDKMYKHLCPKEHASQYAAAQSTAFHIPKTAFSTVTTNLNFRTAAHYDSGDWSEGFGNLVVIERGKPYKGAHTGFPQYGVAVDCRTGDFLAMDVHQIHGNSPMVPGDETSERISLVSYLRQNIVKNCKGQEMYDPSDLHKRITRGLKRRGFIRQTRKQRKDDEMDDDGF